MQRDHLRPPNSRTGGVLAVAPADVGGAQLRRAAQGVKTGVKAKLTLREDAHSAALGGGGARSCPSGIGTRRLRGCAAAHGMVYAVTVAPPPPVALGAKVVVLGNEAPRDRHLAEDARPVDAGVRWPPALQADGAGPRKLALAPLLHHHPLRPQCWHGPAQRAFHARAVRAATQQPQWRNWPAKGQPAGGCVVMVPPYAAALSGAPTATLGADSRPEGDRTHHHC